MKRIAKPVKLPKFASEDAERAFWASTDTTTLVDWSRAKTATFPNLKPTVCSISLRLPQAMLNELKMLANQRDVPYQSLLKIFLSERIEQERRQHT
jgi:predicted DNA binding CopG/RHH family protein